MKWILTVALLQLSILYDLVCVDLYPFNQDGIRLGYFERKHWCYDCSLMDQVQHESKLFGSYFVMAACSLWMLGVIWLAPSRLKSVFRLHLVLGIIAILSSFGRFNNWGLPVTMTFAFWVAAGICMALTKRYQSDAERGMNAGPTLESLQE